MGDSRGDRSAPAFSGRVSGAGTAFVWLLVSSQAMAQISRGPTVSPGGFLGQSPLLQKPTWADYPVEKPAASVPQTVAETPLHGDESGVSGSSSAAEGRLVDRLQALSVRSRKTPRVTRSSRSKVDGESDESADRRVFRIDDLLGNDPSATSSWKRGSPIDSQTATDSSRLRSSLWRRGGKPGDDARRDAEVLLTEAPDSRRPLTGGVRAGAPPARPGYGAKEQAKKVKTLNAGAPLPERRGIGNVVLRDP